MEHPDENYLAAYIENKLQQNKRVEVESHLADCLSCREVLALYASTTAKMQPTVLQFRKKPLIPGWVLSIAALLALAITAFLIMQMREPPPGKQVAQNPSESPIDDSYLTRRGGKKLIEGKTFLLRNGIWIDQDYEAAGKPVVIEIKRSSSTFQDLVNDKPVLKKFADAGNTVIVFFENKAYKFTPP
jgi:hypothetical protein